MGSYRLYVLVFAPFLLLTLFSSPALSSDKVPETPVQFGAQSFPGPEGKTYLALNYDNHQHWHTYWKNPGDSGLPIETFFTVDGEKVQIKALEWPNPKRYFEDGDILAFGYEGAYSLFFRPTQKQLKKWEGKPFRLKSEWLVCKHICIPGEKELKGTWEDGQLQIREKNYQVDKTTLNQRLEKLPDQAPLPPHLELVLSKSPTKKKTLALYYTIDQKAQAPERINLLTPFPRQGLSFRREKLFHDRGGLLYGKYLINWEGEYLEPPREFPQNGQFSSPIELKFLYQNPLTGKTQVIQKTFTKFLPDYGKRANSLLSDLTPIPVKKDTAAKNKSKMITSQENKSHKSFYSILLLAFIGGLILNFMPCVLPVISLKLFSLIIHQDESRQRILKHNLSYTFGILVSFLVLAGALIGLQSTGETVGWGFQLQSPIFVGLMIVLLFVFTLNLFGLFEFKTPGGSKFGAIQPKQGFLGDFGSGVLATILSTPCSAPFLGTALTFAFTSEPITIITVFVFIGLGLASPFILTGIFPRLVHFLPKPGEWMEDLKKLLGLTLILTILWLLDVFLALIPSSLSFMKLMTGLIFLFFFFYSRRVMKKRWFIHWPALALAAFFTINSLATVPINSTTKDGTSTQTALMRDKTEKGLEWEAFSREKLAEYRKKGELVFLDFTAKWCVTCKVNERLVIDTDRFKSLADEHNMRLLLGDWTRRDPKIGSWLKEHGMVGVPAYFILQHDGTLVNLGETISFSEIEKYL